MEILLLLSAFCFSFVEPQVFRTIRVVPVPFHPSRFFRDPVMFRSTRPRWSWQRCFDYPWIPRCQRFFRRMHERRFQTNTNPFPINSNPVLNSNLFERNINPFERNTNPFERNTNPQPFHRNIRQTPPPPPDFRFRGQTSPINVRFPNPRFPNPRPVGQVPDISRIQPVCNISCAPGLRLVDGECQDIGLDSLCNPVCPNGYICHHGHCDYAPCNPACTDGLTCRDGKCLDIGRCEPSCCPGRVCYRGSCRAENEVPRPPPEPVCNPPCPPGFFCHSDSSGGHCDKETNRSSTNSCPHPCVPPEVCHNGHCELDAHTLTHLTSPDLGHTHDNSDPTASGHAIPVHNTRSSPNTAHHDHHDHHHEGDHGHHHGGHREQTRNVPGQQTTDFLSGFRRTTPGAFGSQQQPRNRGLNTQDTAGVNDIDIHARIASEFRRSNIPDSQLGIDLTPFQFQDPVTGQAVDLNNP